MRVLAMCHAYPPHHNAGAEMTLHSELRHMVKRGHTVDVLLSRATSHRSQYKVDGVSVFPYKGDGDPYMWFTGKKPDVVISHLENTPRAAALSDQFRVPMVHLIHNTHAFTKGALNRGPAQLAVFNSEWMRDEYEAFWAYYGNGQFPPSIVVNPPVYGDEYTVVEGQHDRITLINLNEDKGGKLFWELAAALPKLKFLGVTGAYGEQIIPDEIPPNVMVMKHLKPEDMSVEVYARTKILLMPSGYESWGRTAIEAAHSGIPTIAHPTPGLVEALDDAGIFVDREDLDGWINAIRDLRNPSVYLNASSMARSLAVRRDPAADLERFTGNMEGVVRRGFATVAR